MTSISRPEPLRARLRRALPAAMTARDASALSALRSALAAIDNAEAVVADGPAPEGGVIAKAHTGVGRSEVVRRELPESAVTALVRAEVTERLAAASQYLRAGQPDRAARLEAEAAVLSVQLDGV